MANFPQDPFDEVPADLKRVGAHRTPRKRGRGAIGFAWAALATGVLVVGGLYGLSRVNPDISFQLPNFGGGETPLSSPSPSGSPVAPVTDPKTVPKELNLSISIFNGSSKEVKDVAGDAIKAAGWPNPSRVNASSRSIPTTTVYYSNAKYEGIARGLLQLLAVPNGKIALTDNYSNPVTIVLGEDYATLAAG
jgi:hypothetical protein